MFLRRRVLCASRARPSTTTIAATSLCFRRLSSTAPARNHPSSPVLSYPYTLVETPEALAQAVKVLESARCVAMDVEAFCTPSQTDRPQLGSLSLVQACCDTHPAVFLFDVRALTIPVFADHAKKFFSSDANVKLFFDCRRDVEALSTQTGLVPRRVLDLQLYFTALQWKLRSTNRRSSMTYVLKHLLNVERQAGDAAVQAAMTLGDRPVWDVRPLPPHLLEYAADDVRHILLLSKAFTPPTKSTSSLPSLSPSLSSDRVVPFLGGVSAEAVERLSAMYVQHYATGSPVMQEIDGQPAEVHVPWLESIIGAGGVCGFCGAKGHTEADCFQKSSQSIRCTFCGSVGHLANNCFKKFPQLLRCAACGQIGHSVENCFKAHPCTHCGGRHHSANCHQRSRVVGKREIKQ